MSENRLMIKNRVFMIRVYTVLCIAYILFVKESIYNYSLSVN